MSLEKSGHWIIYTVLSFRKVELPTVKDSILCRGPPYLQVLWCVVKLSKCSVYDSTAKQKDHSLINYGPSIFHVIYNCKINGKCLDPTLTIVIFTSPSELSLMPYVKYDRHTKQCKKGGAVSLFMIILDSYLSAFHHISIKISALCILKNSIVS